MREVIINALIDRMSPGVGSKVGLNLTIFYGDGDMCEVSYDKRIKVNVGGSWAYVTHESVDILLEDATSLSAMYYGEDGIGEFIDYTYPQENDVDTKLF